MLCRILLVVLCSCSFAASQTNRHVILVIIDGARYSETLGDSFKRFTPQMHALAQQGAIVDTFLNDAFTYTSRGIPAIWCGSWSIPKDTVVDGLSNQYATVPTVWEYFRKERRVDSTQALYVMKYLSTPWMQSYYPEYGPQYWPWYILQGSTDMDVWDNAKNKLQLYHPTLTVIYLADVDHYGHSGNWDAYTNSIRTADSIIGMIWKYVQDDVVYKNSTTLMVTNDHGRHSDGISSGFTGHGDGCWGCRKILMLAVGDGIAKGRHIQARYTIPDIAPTIGALLQFSTPYASGKPIKEMFNAVTVGPRDGAIPATFSLKQNYPNPFNPTTTIEFTLASKAYTTLKVYDLLGRVVATLVQQELKAGKRHQVLFTPAQNSSGVYICVLESGNQRQAQKLVFLK